MRMNVGDAALCRKRRDGRRKAEDENIPRLQKTGDVLSVSIRLFDNFPCLGERHVRGAGDAAKVVVLDLFTAHAEALREDLRSA